MDADRFCRDSRTLPATATRPALFVQRWRPAVPPRAWVWLLHGYMEHGGRYAELAAYLATAGLATAAVDLRGHGRSGGPRGFVAGGEDYLEDLRAARGADPEPALPHFLLGHSNGGLIALQAALAGDMAWRGVIVTNPYLAATAPAPRLKRMVGHLAGRLWPRLALPAAISADDLTHDPEKQAAHRSDPLIFGHATAGWYRATTALQGRLLQQRHLPQPLLFVYSDADPVACPRHSARLAAQLQAADKTVVVRPGEAHEVLNETQRTQLFAVVAAWVQARA